MTKQQSGYSPRVRAFIGVGARFALLIIVMQLVAIDHWHGDVSSVVGVEDSQRHVLHCHGGGSGCADVSGLIGLVSEASVLPNMPLPDSRIVEVAMQTPAAAFVPTPDRPPSLDL
jgi:hypothetical protein